MGLFPCVHIETVVAEETDEGHPEFLGQRDSEAARRADGCEHGHASHQRFLD